VKFENYGNCPGDCPSGSKDGYCDGVEDGKCDPDCKPEEDPDCGKFPLWYVILGIIGVILLVVIYKKLK